MTQFLENIINFLPEWRRSLHKSPVITWAHFVENTRQKINPLAANDHMREIIQQLQLMGEVSEDKDINDPKRLYSNFLYF
jgi:hypothetical protein